MVISAITKMTAKVLIVRLSRAIAAKSARHLGKKQKPTKGSSAALFTARFTFNDMQPRMRCAMCDIAVSTSARHGSWLNGAGDRGPASARSFRLPRRKWNIRSHSIGWRKQMNGKNSGIFA
jgi:hypothetical protein